MKSEKKRDEYWFEIDETENIYLRYKELLARAYFATMTKDVKDLATYLLLRDNTEEHTDSVGMRMTGKSFSLPTSLLSEKKLSSLLERMVKEGIVVHKVEYGED